jgi:hypothetical protein
MQEESQISKDGSDPHKGKHFDTNVCPDVELILCCEGDFCRDADDSRNDGSEGNEDS